MGRRPSSFFLSACNEAPKKAYQTEGGTQLAETIFTNLHSVKGRPRGPAFWSMSCRCCGRRPSQPAADPGAKDYIALINSNTVHELLHVLTTGVGRLSWGMGGCLQRKELNVSKLVITNLP